MENQEEITLQTACKLPENKISSKQHKSVQSKSCLAGLNLSCNRRERPQATCTRRHPGFNPAFVMA